MEVTIAILKDHQAGPHTFWKKGEIIQIETREAETLVKDGIAIWYSEFRQSMLQEDVSEAAVKSEPVDPPPADNPPGDASPSDVEPKDPPADGAPADAPPSDIKPVDPPPADQEQPVGKSQGEEKSNKGKAK